MNSKSSVDSGWMVVIAARCQLERDGEVKRRA